MIKQTTSGRWQVYGRRGGKNSYVGTFDSKREAESAERRHLVTQEQIAAGELPAEIDDRRTVAEGMTEWLASLESKRSRSRAPYGDRVDSYINPRLGGTPIARVTKSHVIQFRDELSTRFAPATVNGVIVCLASAFSYFVDRQWVETNPCRGVAQVKGPDRLYEWIQTREEITKLILACPATIRDMVILSLGTGMRLDEVLHLQWVDVDIERRLISVHRGRTGTTKSGKARRIPILDALLPFVRELALKRGGNVLVFPAPPPRSMAARAARTKQQAWSRPGVRKPFKAAATKAGLPKALRWHDMRHTFASHWVLDGGDIFRLSKILGHSSVVITQKTYAHLVPEMWTQDYHRVAFRIPTGTAAVIPLRAAP